MDELHLASFSQENSPTEESAIGIEYGSKHEPSQLVIPLPVLHDSRCLEQWSGVDWELIKDESWTLYKGSSFLFGWLEVQQVDNLSASTQQCYQQLFRICESSGAPHLLRTWNYFADINAGNPSQYQLFCEGRANAYAQLDSREQDYPAATVIGTQQNSFILMFIAANRPGFGIENPRQTSAFHYPKKYSEHPPLFSRALVYQDEKQKQLYISGTASITGHSTQHLGNIKDQLQEALNNLDALINEAQTRHGFEPFSLRDFAQLKVFIKHQEDINTVHSYLVSELGNKVPVCYLHGEMCRPDLLVEIEATYLESR